MSIGQRAAGHQHHGRPGTAVAAIYTGRGDSSVPCYSTRCGPICRTVTDAAKVLSVIAGYDPADPLTAMQIDRAPTVPYEQFCIAGLPVGFANWHSAERQLRTGQHT